MCILCVISCCLWLFLCYLLLALSLCMYVYCVVAVSVCVLSVCLLINGIGLRTFRKTVPRYVSLMIGLAQRLLPAKFRIVPAFRPSEKHCLDTSVE